MGTHLGSRPTGNTIGTYASRIVPDANYYTISNPTLQWIMSAQNGSNLVANTAQDLSDGYDTTYTGNWVSSNASTKTSYTNYNGDTRYYYAVPGNSNLRTTSNTSDAASIISNGGYTMWFTFIPYPGNSGWSRLFNYFQLSNGSTGSGISNTSSFGGPIIFYNRGSSRIEYRQPANTGANGDYAAIFSITSGTNVSLSIVVSQTSAPVAKFWGIRNGVALNTATTLTYTGSAGYGIKNVQNNAIPVFCDNIYNSTSYEIMEGGFANRPYTDAECLTLVQALDNKYKF